MVQTMEAIVDFGPQGEPKLATRHLQRKSGSEPWSGHNSDRAQFIRAEIIRQALHDKAVAERAEVKVAELQAKLDRLKGKRGAEVREARNRLQETFKTAEAAFAAAKAALEKSSQITGSLDETHPEFVKFA